MRFSPKIVRSKDGGAEIRLSIKLSPDEVKALDRIPDEPHIDSSFGILRQGGPSQGSKVDFFMCYLRIICHWVDIWNCRDTMGDHIMASAQRRKALIAAQSQRKKRKRRK